MAYARVPQASQVQPKPSVVDHVVEAIRDRLQSGDYAPGHHLVESEVTREFGVSRGPVREAFRRLAAQGLLSNEHNRGFRARRLSRQDVVSLYQAREVLEGLGARLAATHIGEADYRARLRALLKDMGVAIQSADVDNYYHLNEALHGLIIEMSGNTYLLTMVDQLRIPAMRLQFRQRNQLERSRRSHEDHKPLIQAILRGEQDAAEHAMREHIRNSANYVDALFEPVAPVPVKVAVPVRKRLTPSSG
jgi:DNA-binding GntR family transcriptional regulator